MEYYVKSTKHAKIVSKPEFFAPQTSPNLHSYSSISLQEKALRIIMKTNTYTIENHALTQLKTKHLGLPYSFLKTVGLLGAAEYCLAFPVTFREKLGEKTVVFSHAMKLTQFEFITKFYAAASNISEKQHHFLNLSCFFLQFFS